MHPLKGKRALACGASHGIGQACAMELARQGASVTVVARDEAALSTAKDGLCTEAGQPHAWLAADFSDPASLQDKVMAQIAESGPFHVLINNTGGPPSGPLLEATPEQLADGFSKHVQCFQLLVQALVPGMKEADYGRILNIISTSVILPIQGLGVSNTTRGAVANWGRTMAAELAPFGITVNNILPGYTDTVRLQSLFDKKAARSGMTPDAVKKEVIAAIPMKRLASPAEIAAVVGFLASPAASYTTGLNLPIDGGRTAIQ